MLGYDWLEAWKDWREAGQPTPPVMITVCNRTETAARVKHAFDKKRVRIEELCQRERILHIDSKVLEKAEAQEDPAPQASPPASGESRSAGVPACIVPRSAGVPACIRRTP